MSGTSSSSNPPELRRELGLLSATMIVVGGIIGGGIFFTPARVAQTLPSGAWVLAIWALGGIVGLAGALTFAELGAMLPDAGGQYVYIRDAFGRLPAFLFGWMQLASIATASDAAVALVFAEYAGKIVNVAPIGGTFPLAVGTVVLLTIVNYVGLKPGTALQNAVTMSKIVALALLIGGGLVTWTRIGGGPPAVAAPAPAMGLLAGLAAAFIPVLFTVGGWENVNMVAGEVRDPGRLLPRALGLGLGIVIVCYLGANAVYLHALGRDGLAASTAVASDTAMRIIGPAGRTAITVAIMLSILGIVNVILLATPRIFYAMAKDGLFLSFAGRVHPRFGTPHLSILLMGGWAVALLFIARGQVNTLVDGVVFADWIFFGLAAASIFVLRRTRPDAPRPYRAWGYPLVPGFFVLAAIAAVASAVASAPRTSALGSALLLVGAGIYALTLRGAPKGQAS